MYRGTPAETTEARRQVAPRFALESARLGLTSKRRNSRPGRATPRDW